MSVYVNYAPLKWDNRDFVQLCFSGKAEYHTPHFDNYKSDWEAVKTFIALMKQRVLAKDRNYEGTEKIWFIPEVARAEFEKLFASTRNFIWQKHTDLLDYIITSKDIYDKQQLQAQEARERARHGHIKAENVEDFFHQFKEPSPQGTKLSLIEIEKRWMSLLGSITVQKIDKLNYRRAAMQLHPDRNNGDGSKMSELNMLWQEYVKLCPEAK